MPAGQNPLGMGDVTGLLLGLWLVVTAVAFDRLMAETTKKIPASAIFLSMWFPLSWCWFGDGLGVERSGSRGRALALQTDLEQSKSQSCGL